MESHKAITASGTKLTVLSGDSAPIANPSNDSGLRFSEAYRIKGVTRSIVLDALKVLDDMRKDCQNPPALLENYLLLRHYLDYLNRFCDGKV